MVLQIFFIEGCRQIKILEKTVRSGIPSSQTIQNTETATKMCTAEKVIRQKISSES